jgi:MFS family permease
LILDYTPLQVGLAFLPANVIMAGFSLGLSAKIVMRFGITRPLVVGLLLATAGLVLFAQAPRDGDFLTQILPSMLLLGVGAGMGFNPLLLAAMNDVDANDSGLASGVVNTAFMMGGALGLAILASIAGAKTQQALAAGIEKAAALVLGYHLAFLVGAVFALVAALLGAALIRARAGAGEAAAPPSH